MFAHPNMVENHLEICFPLKISLWTDCWKDYC